MNQQIQQNLNQIVSMCNQLSQNEQSNVSKLTQLAELERTAAQQLQHCAQMCQQVNQQMQQMMSHQQFSNINVGQHFATTTTGGTGYPGNVTTGSWANRPISTGNFGTSGQYGGSPYAFTGQYGTGKYETATEISPATTKPTFNTNKDMNS